MKIPPIVVCALLGAGVSLYGAVMSAIALSLGLFTTDWGRMEMADVSGQVQSPRLVELLHAAHEASHSAVVAMSKATDMAQTMAIRDLIMSFAAFVLFCTIAFLERRRKAAANAA